MEERKTDEQASPMSSPSVDAIVKMLALFKAVPDVELTEKVAQMLASYNFINNKGIGAHSNYDQLPLVDFALHAVETFENEKRKTKEKENEKEEQETEEEEIVEDELVSLMPIQTPKPNRNLIFMSTLEGISVEANPMPMEYQIIIRQNVATRELFLYNNIPKQGKKRQYTSLTTIPFLPLDHPTHDPACPFCVGNEKSDTPPSLLEIPDPSNLDQWTLRVVANTFPYIRPIGNVLLGQYGDVHLQMEAKGYHEVVVESHLHNASIPYADKEYAHRIVKAFLERGREIGRDTRVRYISFFKNHGPLSGGSLVHPHCQIVGLTVYPSQERALLQNAADFHNAYNECLYCKSIVEDIKYNRRIVHTTTHFITLCPFASRDIHTLWILPRQHQHSFLDLSPDSAEAEDLAASMFVALRALCHVLEGCSFNYVIHTAPQRPPRTVSEETMQQSFHWFLEVIPHTRAEVLGGFSTGTGIVMTVGSPSEAAAKLRHAINKLGLS